MEYAELVSAKYFRPFEVRRRPLSRAPARRLARPGDRAAAAGWPDGTTCAARIAEGPKVSGDDQSRPQACARERLLRRHQGALPSSSRTQHSRCHDRPQGGRPQHVPVRRRTRTQEVESAVVNARNSKMKEEKEVADKAKKAAQAGASGASPAVGALEARARVLPNQHLSRTFFVLCAATQRRRPRRRSRSTTSSTMRTWRRATTARSTTTMTSVRSLEFTPNAAADIVTRQAWRSVACCSAQQGSRTSHICPSCSFLQCKHRSLA